MKAWRSWGTKGKIHHWTENVRLCMKMFFLCSLEEVGRWFKKYIRKLWYLLRKTGVSFSVELSRFRPWFVSHGGGSLHGSINILMLLTEIHRVADFFILSPNNTLCSKLSFLCLSLSSPAFLRWEITHDNLLGACSLSIKSALDWYVLFPLQ